MDAREHARFLDYLERFDYFRRPGVLKLDPESFLALERELRTLRSTDPENPRIALLRRALFRD